MTQFIYNAGEDALQVRRTARTFVQFTQYFIGVLGRACGAQGTSAGADANGCTVGMTDGHVKTSVVPRARIHDIHVHIQNKQVNALLARLDA